MHGEALHDAPEDQAAYDDAVERAYLGVGDLTSDPDALAALDARLGTLRCEKAMRHARDALCAGDTAAALSHTRVALGQRRAPKPLVIAGVLTVAPGLLRRAQLTSSRWGRWSDAPRRSRGGRRGATSPRRSRAGRGTGRAEARRAGGRHGIEHDR